MSERQLLEAVRNYAQLLGWLCYHTYDSRRSEPGFPDLVLVRGGRLIFAELKAEGKYPSRGQKKWLAELGDVARYSMGNVAVEVWRPSDWLAGRIEEKLRWL